MNFILKDSLLNQDIFFIYYKGVKDNHDFVNESIASYFNALDTIQINSDSFAIMIHEIPEPLEDSLYEILDLLKLELNLDLQFLVGNKQRYTKDIEQTLKLEIEYLAFTTQRIDTINNLYIHQKLIQELDLASINPYVYELIKSDSDLSDMIQTLWETSGNIAQSATQLYLHRNTLIYRIDKYKKDTQLDLKNQNDLLISYLMTLI